MKHSSQTRQTPTLFGNITAETPSSPGTKEKLKNRRRPTIRFIRKSNKSRSATVMPKHRFVTDTPLPRDRTYHQVEEQIRGTGAGSIDYQDNQGSFSNSDQRELWHYIDRLRDGKVATNSIVMALLDAAVDLTCTQLPPEGDAYTPFVEAMADLFNHYAALGVADTSPTW